MSTNLYTRFSAAPLELRIFATFSVLITIFGLVLPILGPKHLWEVIVPFTGWNPALGYMFGLFFTFALVFSTSPLWVLRLGSITPLAMQIIVGLLEMAKPHANNFHNPYLTVSPWRPVWTVIIPALWIVLLLSPRISRFGKAPDNSPVA